MNNDLEKRLRTAKRCETFADLAESIGPLLAVLGTLMCFYDFPYCGITVALLGISGVFSAAWLREKAATHRSGSQAMQEHESDGKTDEMRQEAQLTDFVITRERIETLRGHGAGNDVVLALRPYVSKTMVAGSELIPELQKRIGIRRTDESLGLLCEYLTDRRRVPQPPANPDSSNGGGSSRQGSSTLL